MMRSLLFGRRVHITGSISADPTIATRADVESTRRLVQLLVPELVRRGANFVIPVDREPVRPDGLPICFDWLIWEALNGCLASRPPDAPAPLAIAVQHYKSEDQVPPDKAAFWDVLRDSPLVRIENAAYWNMASKRMEAQARAGDILVALGGTEGVLFLANLYHDAGKPVVPLDLPITGQNEGARKLFAFGLTSSRTDRLFRTVGENGSHSWINRIRFASRQAPEARVASIISLLEALSPPRAFGVRLLDPSHIDFGAVEDHFENIVRPVVEGELGFELTVIDGRQRYEHARIDEEIFVKLHRSNVVLADITGSRPNCFLELGYALGRQLPTMVMGREGAALPFDITTISGLHWKTTGTTTERRSAFREHWNAIRNRPPIVPVEPLMP
jgi:hypothetical protein